MHLTYGDQTPIPEQLEQATRLTFFTGQFDLKWSHCSSTADFLSGLYSTVLAPGRTPAQIKDLAHSISYLANELVENVVKFRAPGDVEISAGIAEGEFVLRIDNWITAEVAERFQDLLRQLTAGDPGDLLIQRIEENAVGDGNGSGLGILTLMSDYGVRLTWQFRPGSSGQTLLRTCARLAIPTA